MKRIGISMLTTILVLCMIIVTLPPLAYAEMSESDDLASIKTKAEKGNAEAQFQLGSKYYTGWEEVAKDEKLAEFWYTKAAEQGHADAQTELAYMYLKGIGVSEDYKQALAWYSRAAEQGDMDGQFWLGHMYAEGIGVVQNNKLAYVWFSLSATSGDKNAMKWRDIYNMRLSPQVLAEAQELAALIQDKIDQKANSPKKDPESVSAIPDNNSHQSESSEVKSSGTGFIITRDGYILTCQHVIDGASKIKVAAGNDLYPARVISKDKNNDLALLKITGDFTPLAFAPERSAKLGQETFTLGFPNPELQGVSPKLTKGGISSLTGVQDDVRLYQISVPVQPGNSGGPLLDNNGNVTGVIVAMLDAATVFKLSGSLPQNVNYALKSSYALSLLDTVPEVVSNLPSPGKNEPFDTTVNRVTKGIVMILVY
jgi:S1-C subfamily serine protease